VPSCFILLFTLLIVQKRLIQGNEGYQRRRKLNEANECSLTVPAKAFVAFHSVGEQRKVAEPK